MPLDPNIILSGQVPDVGSAISNSILNAQRLGSMQTEALQRDMIAERLGQLRENAPLELEKLKQDTALSKDVGKLKSIAFGALQIKPLIDSGDFEGALAAAESRAESLNELGVDSSDTMQLVEALKTGRFQEAAQMVDGAIQLGQQIGVIQGGDSLDISKINPKDYTTESLKAYKATGDFTQLIPRPKEPLVKIDFGEKPISTQESLLLVDEEGNHPAPGMTHKEAGDRGFKPMGTEAQKQIQASKGANALIGELEKLSTAANAFSDKGWFNRLNKTFENMFKQFGQGDTNLNTFIDTRKATLSLLVRALGEKGTLTQQDVARIDNAIPRASGYAIVEGKLVDTKGVAAQKWQALGGIINSIAESVRQRGGKTDEKVMNKITTGIDSGEVIEPFPGFNLLSEPEKKEVLDAL